MKGKNYIPQNRCDVIAVQRLKDLPFESVKKNVPELLEWLQDTHWEVAEGIANYLLPHVNEITQELLFVLNTDDGMWKSIQDRQQGKEDGRDPEAAATAIGFKVIGEALFKAGQK